MASDNEELISQIFGWVGLPFALCLFLSSAPMIFRLRKDRDTKKVSELIFIVTSLQCLSWVNHFCRDYDLIPLTPNSIGWAIETLYYEIFASVKYLGRIRILVMTAIIVVQGGIFGIFFFIPVDGVGYIAMILNLLLYASPLQKIFIVIKTYDISLQPLEVNIAGLMLGTCYFVYSLLTNNIFILIPNAFGAVISAGAIILYLIFRPLKRMSDIIKDQKIQIQELENRLGLSPVNIERV